MTIVQTSEVNSVSVIFSMLEKKSHNTAPNNWTVFLFSVLSIQDYGYVESPKYIFVFGSEMPSTGPDKT
jgi:hypothetical protein